MTFVATAKPAVMNSIQNELEQALPALRRYCLSLTCNVWDSEDLFQQTLMKAWPKLQSKTSTLHIEAYLITIAKNCWIDEMRKQTNARSFISQLSSHESSFIADWEVEWKVEEALELLITSLPPLQRTVLLLRDVFGYSGPEVADLLSTTEGAVRVALHRARKTLSRIQSRELEKGQDEQATSLLDSSSLAPKQQCERSQNKSDQLLKSYLLAFRSGDMASIVELGLQDIVEPAVALASVVANNTSTVLKESLEAGWQPNTNASLRRWENDERNSLCSRTNKPWRAKLRHLLTAA
ncbi:RNA polymerase sigma-70 factor (ECF subfamily) [Paenibacillus turicensis]|uniref:RNA polymerase sigma-70 factor (ECF subfamily) n=1 Tax=Paenibacillus turicensis TaxID=160487 RepID=A0ABS4FLH4_9BACL|nr:RNA polymerase sigma factor [Paenibacillus turicensis]MBP1903427.1 RNA polymerase sigma-70 factor (ECF subfamily) [Paenibacillus turicensis]